MQKTAFFFFSSRRRHTRCYRDWSSDVCSSDLTSCPTKSLMPTSSLATVKAFASDPMNTSSAALATSIPTNLLTSSMFHPPQRGLPRLAIRDFLPLQPFGLSVRGGAAALAARRDLSPKGAPACRTTNSDSFTTSSTYKAAEKGGVFHSLGYSGVGRGCRRRWRRCVG